jgi:hypothetical protein
MKENLPLRELLVLSPPQIVLSLHLPPFSNGASFVNPKEGQIVHPGETIHIDLVVDAGLIPLKGVGIVSPMGFFE